MKISKNRRNEAVDAARVWFAVLIVALHTLPLSEYNDFYSYFLCHVYSRLAVPFFALVSGYFFSLNYSVEKGRQFLRRTTITYLLWNTICLLIDVTLYGKKINLSIILSAFFFEGLHHLWYMLAVIYMTIIVLLIGKEKFKSKTVLVIATLLLLQGIANKGYGNILHIGFPIHNSMIEGWATIVFPAYFLGFKMAEFELPKPAKCLLLCICAIMLYSIEVFIITKFDIHENNVSCVFTLPTVAFMFQWLIQKNERKNSMTLGRKFGQTANLLYYAHVPLIYVIRAIDRSIRPTFLFCIIIATLLPLGMCSPGRSERKLTRFLY